MRRTANKKNCQESKYTNVDVEKINLREYNVKQKSLTAKEQNDKYTLKHKQKSENRTI